MGANNPSAMDHYSSLKSNIIRELIYNNPEDEMLQTLLQHCEHLIESRRAVEDIRRSRSLRRLFETLERRDELSEDDVSILGSVATWSGVIHVEEMVLQYMKMAIWPNRCRICQYSRTRGTSPVAAVPALNISRVKKAVKMETNYESEEDERPDIDCAIEAVAPKVGRRWTDIARSLKLTEEDIDGIDMENRRLMDKIHAMFKLWKEYNGKRATRDNLRIALQKSRRKDLSDMLSSE